MQQIILTLPSSSLPSLMLYQIPDGADDFCVKSTVDTIKSGDLTIQGVDTLLGGGRQYFVWSFQVCLTHDETLLFDEIRYQQQNRYENQLDGYLILQDEKYYVTASEASLNSRTSIANTTTSWGGVKHFISCPVFLRVPEQHRTQLAEDLWLLQFDAKELAA